MDDFVCDKLKEWGLAELIDIFRGNRIDSESFYMLGDGDINELIPIIGQRLKFKNRFNLLKAQQKEEDAHEMTEVLPSTSDTGKRRSDPRCKSSKETPVVKRQRETNSSAETEARILNDVKNKMGKILAILNNQKNTNLNTFLKTKIRNLETEKKELVGVFGKTGAGKTSLINAVIEEKGLLPSGSIEACTSVMIKVEANRHNEIYEAVVEFISPEEWEDEMGSLFRTIEKGDQEMDNNDDDDNDDYHEAFDKLSALYDEEWKERSCEQLMESKCFKDIPEFLHSKQKTLAFKSAKNLSADIVKYTRNGTKDNKYKAVKRWYWPLVKCVTIKVPNNNLLQHVTLVDLPGNGDRNKSRDTMWKGIVGDCSAVWVVTEINRAASERESWEILKSVSSLLGNGGECRHIHFICTKSDDIENIDDHSKADAQALIIERNMEAKKSVTTELNKLTKIKKHFSDECFKVFTVSSREFFTKRHLSPENTEIPRLQGFLKNLNDCHSETLNYVSGAHGILSLIHGASLRNEDGSNSKVCEALEENLHRQTKSVRNEMQKILTAFEERLQEGVEKSKSSCENILKTALYPKRKSGRGFHRQLKKAVENGGICKYKKGKEMNLNMELSSPLTLSIDDEFRKTFPNEGQCGPFNGVINMFSLGTEGLKQTYKDVELQLVFLKSEEDHLKTDLKKSIRKQKKNIYRSLTKTVEETMQDCYKKAAVFTGEGTLQNMRETIEKHVHGSKNNMFESAKDVMNKQLDNLMLLGKKVPGNYDDNPMCQFIMKKLFTLNQVIKVFIPNQKEVLNRLENTMKESIELSLKADDHSIPDVSAELKMVQELYNELRESS